MTAAAVGAVRRHPIAVGFIGCGEIARLHADCLQRLGARIAGGYDVSAEAASALAAAYGGRAYASAQALCETDEVEAVYICTRHDSHVHYIELAARAGKAVFCEKPIALDEPSAAKAADIVARHGIPFVIGFNHRYAPGIDRLKRYLDGQARPFDVMNVQFVTAPFLSGWAGLPEQGGGVAVCLGSHVFDLIGYLTGGALRLERHVALRRRLGEPYLADALSAIFTSDAGQLITVNAHDLGNARFSVDPGRRINTVHAFVGEEAAVASVGAFERFGRDGAVREAYPDEDIRTLWGYAEINRRFLRIAAGESAEAPGVEAALASARWAAACRA